MKKWLLGGVEFQSLMPNVSITLLRLFTGLALAFGHGLGKIPPSERFVEGVAKLGFPLPSLFAWSAGSAEFFGGLLLAAGLLTRPSAFFIFITMTVAAIMRHANDPFAVKEKALLYGFVALVFLIVGCGKYGLDAVISRRLS